MKKGILSFFALLCLSLASISAGDFYGIIIADTEAENIGDYVHIDFFRMNQELSKMAQNLNRPYKQITFTGGDVEGQRIVNQIKKMRFEKDDIVFFYFSGHGQRAALHESDPWPLMLFSTNGGAALDFSEITTHLLKKNPKLLIAFADCCNFHQSMTPPLVTMARVKGAPVHSDKELIRANIHKLFEQRQGLIMASGSQPGEPSWSCPFGSYFTIYWINAYQNALKEQDPSWEVIFEKTAGELEEHQHPQYLIIPSIEEAQMTLEAINS